MSAAAEIVREVLATGATIRADGDALKIRPASLVPPMLLDRVKAHKAELLRELTAANDPPKPPGRAILHFRLTGARGGNAGGTVIADGEVDALVLELVERYGARLDLDDLLERVRERFAIAAESAPDAEALRVAMTEAEAVIRRAMTR